MKRKIILMVIILLMVFLVANHAIAVNNEQSIYDPLTDSQMSEIIVSGLDWMLNAQEYTGHFKYEYAPYLDRYIDQDNIVRQAGALMVLGEILIRTNYENPDLKDAIVSSIEYFDKNSDSGKNIGFTFKCVLKNSTTCTLGGTSLALIGILDLVKKYPDMKKEYGKIIEDYTNYILAMKRKDKGFSDAFYFNRAQINNESPFSNGEAFLALVRYNQYNSRDEVKDAIQDAWVYFEELYGNEPDSAFYLWGMSAIKDLYFEDPRKEYVDFVKKYSDWRLATNENKRNTFHNRCAYIEGVVSAYSVLENNLNETEKQRYEEEIDYWLWKHSKFQVKENSELLTRFNSERSFKLNVKNQPNAWGGFITGFDEPVQRIDFTQHCVSSYLQKYVDIDGKKLSINLWRE